MNGLCRRKKAEDGQPIRALNPLELWGKSLIERVGRLKAKVALANKLARIAWVIIAKGERFNPAKASCSAAVWPSAQLTQNATALDRRLAKKNALASVRRPIAVGATDTEQALHGVMGKK